MPTYECICAMCKKRFSIQLSLTDYEKKVGLPEMQKPKGKAADDFVSNPDIA